MSIVNVLDSSPHPKLPIVNGDPGEESEMNKFNFEIKSLRDDALHDMKNLQSAVIISNVQLTILSKAFETKNFLIKLSKWF